jgi:hypothetical protein
LDAEKENALRVRGVGECSPKDVLVSWRGHAQLAQTVDAILSYLFQLDVELCRYGFVGRAVFAVEQAQYVVLEWLEATLTRNTRLCE